MWYHLTCDLISWPCLISWRVIWSPGFVFFWPCVISWPFNVMAVWPPSLQSDLLVCDLISLSMVWSPDLWWSPGLWSGLFVYDLISWSVIYLLVCDLISRRYLNSCPGLWSDLQAIDLISWTVIYWPFNMLAVWSFGHKIWSPCHVIWVQYHIWGEFDDKVVCYLRWENQMQYWSV